MSLLVKLKDRQNGQPVIADDDDNEFLNIIDVLAGQNVGKSIRIVNSDAAFACARFDQLGANHIVEFFANGGSVGRVEKDGDLVVSGLTGVAGVYTFTEIPIGPNATPTSDNQLSRKKYVDDRKYSFSVGFPIADPATATLNSRDFGSLVIPEGGVVTITKTKVMYREGSHTAGGSLTFKVDRAFVGDISTLSLNDTNDDQAIVYPDNIADITPSADEVFSCYISARSGTITEKSVMVIIEGFRTGFN